jgi:aminopeptidase N
MFNLKPVDMKKNNLTPNKGLSLSQAQSISNLCNQRASEIAKQLIPVNNYSKSVEVDGKKHEILKGKPLPTNVVELLKEKARLHACQAFLMENMKAKEALLKDIKNEQPDFSGIVLPKRPLQELMNINNDLLSEVNETYGWEQLSASEYNEYLEAEAYASHIGQFIHKDSILAGLRAELPEIPAIEWMTIKDGVKSPVMIDVHHNSADLLALHEELAALHRQYEQRVNYFKAKVKNLTTERNAEIAKHNADLQNEAEAFNNKLNGEYDTAFKAYTEKTKSVKAVFEKTRQAKIKEVAGLRIEIDPRFQNVIDTFLNQLPAQE